MTHVPSASLKYKEMPIIDLPIYATTLMYSQNNCQLMSVQAFLIHVGVVWNHGVCTLNIRVVVKPVTEV